MLKSELEVCRRLEFLCFAFLPGICPFLDVTLSTGFLLSLNMVLKRKENKISLTGEANEN